MVSTPCFLQKYKYKQLCINRSIWTKMPIKNFLPDSLSRFATYATVIVIITYNALFEREVACTCKDQDIHCNLYMSIPIFVIMLMLLWKDKTFIGVCRYRCMKRNRKCGCNCTGKYVRVILLQIGKAAMVGLLWLVSVFMDGDWYACCHNGLSGLDAQIPCKEKATRTIEEQEMIDNLKNDSKVSVTSVYELDSNLFMKLIYYNIDAQSFLV